MGFTLHVGIIMDGNGRWATARGLPRLLGHRSGIETARRIVEAAPDHGVGTLTLFAFSSDNWRRPAREVASLMRLFHAYLRAEVETCITRGIRLSIIGQRDRLPLPLRAAVQAAEAATAGGDLLHLRVAVDYSARQAIMRAACRWNTAAEPSCETFARLLGEVDHTGAPVPDVDLLIRTGGEQRLSDFLLWECAFAEFVFLQKRWPEFVPADLEAAVKEFHHRERTRGGLPKEPVS